jgi:hypothetical protein
LVQLVVSSIAAVPLFAELEPLLDRLARALIAHDEAVSALGAAARRLAAGPSTASATRAMARCDLLERRARLHVELARRALQAQRGELLDAQRRVPAAFRRRPPRAGQRSVEIVGNPVERASQAQPPARDRAAAESTPRSPMRDRAAS